MIENSVFGVWKDPGKTQRLIWGGNRSNQLFNTGASLVELPTPDLLSDLQLAKGESLILSGCDISQDYIRLMAPGFLVPFLGMLRIRSNLVATELTSEFVIPCLRCIPMVATLAVQLTQTALRAMV